MFSISGKVIAKCPSSLSITKQAFLFSGDFSGKMSGIKAKTNVQRKHKKKKKYKISCQQVASDMYAVCDPPLPQVEKFIYRQTLNYMVSQKNQKNVSKMLKLFCYL